jgi:steroid 5-alpha reductase family enzyme
MTTMGADLFLLWLQGFLLVALLFFGLWMVEVRKKDASLVDAGWASSLGLLALLYAWRGPGLPERRVFMALLVLAWSLRLASYIVLRHRGAGEDGRYREIRTRWEPRAHRFFFFFYQAQGALAVLLSLPFLLIAFDRSPEVHALEIAGFVLSGLALALETVADRQLARHRRDPSLRGKTCREGLFRYSRHPNYFFEWLVWVGYAVAALGAPYGWTGFASPLLMLYLILRVTGIPPSEERALRNRGEDYRRYQEATSAFVPWFPRKEASS